MTDRPPAPEIAVAELRDYHRVNRELGRALDAGHRLVRLVGVEGQRLLASGLAGGWKATVELDGDAGPELAAGLDAPGLTVLGLGSAADGAGRSLVAGRLVVRGDAGDAVAADQRGGTVVVVGRAGHRAGFGQRGGVLLLLGPAGRLAADRQRGGLVLVDRAALGPHPGRGRLGGRMAALPGVAETITPEDAEALWEAVDGLDPSVLRPR